MKRIIAPKANTVKCCKHVIVVKREWPNMNAEET